MYATDLPTLRHIHTATFSFCEEEMKTHIKYEQLSQDIRKEIDDYFNREKEKGSKLDFEKTMGKWFDDVFDEWMINKYDKDKRIGRRKHFRLNIEIPVKIVETLIEPSLEEHTAIEIIGTILNISRGGLYFKFEKHLEISSIIMVKIDLSAIDRELNDIEALAMVTRAEKIEHNKYGK